MKVNGSLWKRNFDAFLVEPFEDAFSQFVLSHILIGELPHLADEGEIQGRFSKAGNESYKWSRLGQQARYLA